jgi:aconitate hydratase
VSAASLGLDPRARYEVSGVAQGLKPGGSVSVRAIGDDGKMIEFEAVVRIDTPEELVAFQHGGILPYVLRQLVGKN